MKASYELTMALQPPFFKDRKDEGVRQELAEALKRRQQENGWVKGWTRDKLPKPHRVSS